MKKFNWVTTLILHIVTCSIYSIYAWYVMGKNNNELAAKNEIATIRSYIMAMILGCITGGIYLIYWMYKYSKQQIAIAKATNTTIAHGDSAIILTILMFVPIYSFYVLCENHNKCVDAAA